MSSREVTVATNGDVATLIRVRTTSDLKYQGTSDFWKVDLSRMCAVDEQVAKSIMEGVIRMIRKDGTDRS